MDSFGDNFVENEVDPAADFLAREQNELAGLEDELAATEIPVTVDVNDLTTADTTAEFEDLGIEAEALDDFGFERNETPSSPPDTVRERREEPEKIKKWREEQMKSLEEKDELEEKKKEEWRAAAKKELDDWYKQHDEVIVKTRAVNRNAENHLDVEDVDNVKMEPGTEWKRIAKLCDFNKKSTHNIKDASRMRSIILQLQQSPAKTKTV